MVKQTRDDILDILMGTDLDLNKFIVQERTAFRPMETFNNETDFLEAEGIDFAEELCISTVTIDEEASDSFYGEESSSVDCLLSGDSMSSSTIFQFPPASTSQDLPSEYILQEVEDDGLSPITPLIKEEVKMKIKLRRMAEGKEDIRVEFKDPEPEQLTREEEDRRQLRRQKNKMAAQKCRSKKRKLADCLEDETEKLENKQDSLIQEIEKLRQEKEQLEELVKIHSSVCPKMKIKCSH